MNQRLIQRKQTTYEGAQVIATIKNIHKSTVGDIWLVESESKKGKFYAVQELDGDVM